MVILNKNQRKLLLKFNGYGSYYTIENWGFGGKDKWCWGGDYMCIVKWSRTFDQLISLGLIELFEGVVPKVKITMLGRQCAQSLL